VGTGSVRCWHRCVLRSTNERLVSVGEPSCKPGGFVFTLRPDRRRKRSAAAMFAIVVMHEPSSKVSRSNTRGAFSWRAAPTLAVFGCNRESTAHSRGSLARAYKRSRQCTPVNETSTSCLASPAAQIV